MQLCRGKNFRKPRMEQWTGLSCGGGQIFFSAFLIIVNLSYVVFKFTSLRIIGDAVMRCATFHSHENFLSFFEFLRNLVFFWRRFGFSWPKFFDGPKFGSLRPKFLTILKFQKIFKNPKISKIYKNSKFLRKNFCEKFMNHIQAH